MPDAERSTLGKSYVYLITQVSIGAMLLADTGYNSQAICNSVGQWADEHSTLKKL